MKCKICDGAVRHLFAKKVLHKYDVAYFQCLHCRFIQTEQPYWLGEAYEKAIARLDIGLVWRANGYRPSFQRWSGRFSSRVQGSSTMAAATACSCG